MSDQSFQEQVRPWMQACFGAEISADTVERNHRFLEEALELAQACACTPEEARQLVDYVFSRPVGDKRQEVGGVMVTLAALCLAHDGVDMHECGDTELARIWTLVEQIRAKQASKPKNSPLAARNEDSPLSVEIVGGRLSISIGISTLCYGAQAGEGWPRDPNTDVLQYPIVDEVAFAKEVLRELRLEDEVGCTRVHRMLDGAALHALDYGAQGVQYDEEAA